ncbi:MAG: hypothetical protein WC725_03100 [Patescibacteria group bacterium]
MKKNTQIFIFGALILVSVFIFKKEANAAAQCFCVGKNAVDTTCLDVATQDVCDFNNSQNAKYTSCAWMTTVNDCVSAKNNLANTTATAPDKTVGQKWGAFLPACVNETNVVGECRDITVFLILMFNIIRYLFGIIGGVTLLYFVYGGFVLILSQGNAEKVAQGKGIIVAAVLGLIIAFGGYAIVIFVGNAVGIETQFKLNQ